MNKREIPWTDHYQAVMDALRSRGLLLSAYGPDGRPNAMAIGWGLLGCVWGLPIWTVLVRPSRYTYRCIEHSKAFAVNVPGPDLAEACALCGSKSGRDMDKLSACNLTVERASAAAAPTIAECPIHYVCQVVHFNDVLPPNLADEVVASAYAGGNFHRVYFGKIVAVRAAPDAAKRVS